MRDCLNYSGTRFLSTKIKITQTISHTSILEYLNEIEYLLDLVQQI